MRKPECFGAHPLKNPPMRCITCLMALDCKAEVLRPKKKGRGRPRKEEEPAVQAAGIRDDGAADRE